MKVSQQKSRPGDCHFHCKELAPAGGGQTLGTILSNIGKPFVSEIQGRSIVRRVGESFGEVLVS